MPRERRDLISTIIAKKANQLNKEIIVQLDNKAKKEEDKYSRLELEFISNSNRYTENRRIEIQARLKEEYTRDAKRYILQNILLRCNSVGRALIAGKIKVQVDADATRDHFGGAPRLQRYSDILNVC